MHLLFKGNIILQILYCMMLLSSIWTGVSIYITVIFSFAILMFVPVTKYIDKTAVLLLSFSIAYCLTLMCFDVASWTNLISYLICPFLFYCFGQFVVDRVDNIDQLTIFWSISILLFSVILYMSAIQDIIQNGFVNITRSFSIWGASTERSAISATLYGLIASLGLVGLPFFFIKTGTKPIIKCIFLILGICSIMTVLQLVNRTGLVVVALTFIILILYNYKSRFFHIIAACAALIFIFCLLIKLQIINQDVFQAYIDRNDGVGSVSTAGGRTERWITGFQNIFIYPFGWAHAKIQYSYAHNLWLDVARAGGILSFIPLVIATVFSYKIFFKLLRFRDRKFMPLLLGLNVCFFLSSFVEPVIEAIPLYFYLYLMLWGMQSQLLLKFRLYDYSRMEIR